MVNPDIRQYVEAEILPRYVHFDAAHRLDHVQAVIQNSLNMATHYNVNTDMVYVIAAYHDTGLAEGRERHHIVSGDIIRADKQLKRWFDEIQIGIMADAAEEQVLSYAQLVGYKVINSADGACVGEIASVDEQTINIMFELTDGVLLPAAEELIEDIDNDNRTITLRIADGLL